MTRAGASYLPIRNLISMRTYVCIVILYRVSNARVYGVASIVGILLSLVACPPGHDLELMRSTVYAHARIHSHTTHSWNADMPAHARAEALQTLYKYTYISREPSA